MMVFWGVVVMLGLLGGLGWLVETFYGIYRYWREQ